MKPQLWIIAGPNGAGKSTLSERYFVGRLPVVNPDTIAQEYAVSPIQAGKMAIQYQRQYLSTRQSFAWETTLSGHRARLLMREAKESGYKVNLVFVGIRNAHTSMLRITERVMARGHDIARADVKRRFERSLHNLPEALDIADCAFIVDNSEKRCRLLLSRERHQWRHLSQNLPGWMMQALPDKQIKSTSSKAEGALLSYRAAGVDIDAGNALIKRIQPFAQRTWRDGVIKGIGGFGALFEVSKKYREPVLVSGTDGVGTKLKLAAQLGRHTHLGQDLVAMCVNDILTLGAEPLFFLDYFACGKLDVDTAAKVIDGIATGCEQAGCALIGGETAEMPGMYPEGEYDLAGFAVGVVEKSAIIDGRSIAAGDAVIGLASSGLHSNGYALVRQIIERIQPDLNADLDGIPLADALMAPTRIYVKTVRALLEHIPVKGMAHITGGGLIENIPRLLPESLCAELDARAWPQPPIFTWLREHGPLAQTEMQRVFNSGIGMALVVASDLADAALHHLWAAGEAAWHMGAIRTRQSHEARIVVHT